MELKLNDEYLFAYLKQLGYEKRPTGRWMEELQDDGQGFHERFIHAHSATKLQTTIQTTAQIVAAGSWGMNDYVLSGSSCRNIRWNHNGSTGFYKQI